MYRLLLTRLLQELGSLTEDRRLWDAGDLDYNDLQIVVKGVQLLQFLEHLCIVGGKVDIIKELTKQKFGTDDVTQEQIDVTWSEFVDIVE